MTAPRSAGAQRSRRRSDAAGPRASAASSPNREAQRNAGQIASAISPGHSRDVGGFADPREAPMTDDALRQFVWLAKGDPRLSAWEEGFVCSMGAWADSGGARRLSAKQRAVIDAISAKVATIPLPPPFADEAEPDVPDDADGERPLYAFAECDAAGEPGG